MNTYHIRGADRKTGENKTIVAEANDEKAAMKRASEQGLLVEKIKQVKTATAATVVNQRKPKHKLNRSSVDRLFWWLSSSAVACGGLGVLIGLYLFVAAFLAGIDQEQAGQFSDVAAGLTLMAWLTALAIVSAGLAVSMLGVLGHLALRLVRSIELPTPA